MTDLYLFGANSIARILIGYLQEDLRYRLLGVTVNREYCDSSEFYGHPLVPFEDLVQNDKTFGVLNCIGYSKQLSVRAAIDAQIRKHQIPLLSYIHSEAIVQGVEFGEGNLVMNRVTIEQSSAVGNGNIFYGGSYICHDAVIGNYNWFSASTVFAGNTTVGNRNFIGINSSVRENLSIGSMSTIGMGAVVIKDVPDRAVVVGNPAVVKWYNEVGP